MEEKKLDQQAGSEIKQKFPGKTILNNDAQLASENCVPFYSPSKSQELFNETQKKLLKDIQTNIFCNLYPVKMLIDGKEYASTEHYFQMFKYSQGDQNFMEKLSPNDVAAFGQRRLKMQKKNIAIIHDLKQKHKEYPKNDGKDYEVNDIANPKLLIKEWESDKIGVMMTSLRAKFKQNDELQQQLLKTMDCWLVEHIARDKCWGDGENGSGTNYLGKLLMQVRQEIKDGCEYDVDIDFLKTPMSKLINY